MGEKEEKVSCLREKESVSHHWNKKISYCNTLVSTEIYVINEISYLSFPLWSVCSLLFTYK